FLYITLFIAFFLFFFFSCSLSVFGLLSFPTRRSSDLLFILLTLGVIIFLGPYVSYYKMKKHHLALKKQRQLLYQEMTDDVSSFRSEEHTSELQSRFDLVCRLLLEKKKHKD